MITPSPIEERVFVLGTGRLGTALLRELSEAGVAVAGAWTRSSERAAEVARDLGVAVQHGPLPDLAAADIVLLTIPDSAIATTAAQLAHGGRLTRHHILLHCSGALPADVLRHDPGCPRAVGCYHPLQSFSRRKQLCREYFVALQGEESALECGKALARALGHPTFEVLPESKALYHAGAVLAANFLVTLLGYGAELLSRGGVPYETALRALSQLASGAIENLRHECPCDSLTGPVARGDAETVARHLAALCDNAPELTTLYRVMGRYTLALITSRGKTRPGDERLRDLFMERKE